MGVILQQAYALGIMAVFFAIGLLLTGAVYLTRCISNRKSWKRVNSLLERFIFPFQYLVTSIATSFSIITGSSMGLYSPWISFSFVSVFLSFAWINYRRKNIIELRKLQIQDIFDYDSKESESLLYEEDECKPTKRGYFSSIWHGMKSSPGMIIFGIILSFVLTFCLTFSTDGLCIAIRPLSTSTRFTRFFEKDSCGKNSVCHVYFTVSDDPSTSIIVNFHSQDMPDSGFVNYYELNSTINSTVQATWFQMKQLTEIQRYVYWAEVTGLRPGVTYIFVAGYISGGKTYLSEERKIRTVPENGNVTFVSGGDMQNDESGFVMSTVAASHEPYFAMIGGDIAYANGNIHCYKRWDFWFETWNKYMKTPSGFDVPFSLAIGNHEAGGDHGKRNTIPFFLEYFPQTLGLSSVQLKDRPLYHAHTIGNHSMFMVLDSGIVEGMRGSQYDWMEKQLSETKAINKFAIYHYAMYPSITHEYSVNSLDRDAWISLFSKYNLTIGFENHFHVFKRSKTIKDDKAVPLTSDGTTYLGDGAWGIESQDPFLNPHSWWIDSVSRTPHVFVVHVSQNSVKVEAFNHKNEVFNTFTLDRNITQSSN